MYLKRESDVLQPPPTVHAPSASPALATVLPPSPYDDEALAPCVTNLSLPTMRLLQERGDTLRKLNKRGETFQARA